MEFERKNRIEELRWKAERTEKRSIIEAKLKAILDLDSFETLSFQESDEFQLNSDEWPKNKWEDKLYIQTEISNPKPVNEILKKLMTLISGNRLFIFLMNFNFGLIKISKDELIKNWKELIELDGDEIYCYDPSSTDFLCIEKTEEFISGKENEGRKWIYELTFSNQKLKEKINTAHNKT